MNITLILRNLDEMPQAAEKLENDVLDAVINAGIDNSISDINAKLREMGYRLADAGTMHNLYSMCGCTLIEKGRTTRVTL